MLFAVWAFFGYGFGLGLGMIGMICKMSMIGMISKKNLKVSLISLILR